MLTACPPQACLLRTATGKGNFTLPVLHYQAEEVAEHANVFYHRSFAEFMPCSLYQLVRK